MTETHEAGPAHASVDAAGILPGLSTAEHQGFQWPDTPSYPLALALLEPLFPRGYSSPAPSPAKTICTQLTQGHPGWFRGPCLRVGPACPALPLQSSLMN